MNKNNNALTLLAGLLLAAPALYTAASHANEPLTYIDAIGNKQIVGGGHTYTAEPQNTAQQYDATANYAQETAGADYAADAQGAYGNAGPETAEIVYFDAETGEPVPAEMVGTTYSLEPPPGYAAQAAAPQQNAYASPQYNAPQLEQDVLYVDAITGEALSGEEVEAALAYANNAAQNTAVAGTSVQAPPQSNATPYASQTGYADSIQNGYTQAQNAYTAPQPAANQATTAAASGYERYANTDASADQQSTAPAQTQTYNQRAATRVSAAEVIKAVEAGRIDILGSLQSRGADLRASDAQGLTYLHRAAAGGHLKMVQYLLRTGLNPNAKTSKDWTPLHHAARFGHAEVVRALLAAGADERQVTTDGFSAKRLALNVKQHQVAAMLR